MEKKEGNTKRRTRPYLKLKKYFKLIYWPAIKGSIISTFGIFVIVTFCAYALSENLIGIETLTQSWDKVEFNTVLALNTWKGRVGFFLFGFGCIF